MKVLIEQTGTLGRIAQQGIVGEIWRGVTQGGTPIEVLVLDMHVAGDDPVDIARFKLELGVHADPEGHA